MLIIRHSASFEAFGNPSRLLLFSLALSEWFPGLVTWLFDHGSHPGLRNLRDNKAQGRAIARKLLDSKRQELKDGAVRKDVMSLLGSLSPFFYFYCVVAEDLPPSQVK